MINRIISIISKFLKKYNIIFLCCIIIFLLVFMLIINDYSKIRKKDTKTSLITLVAEQQMETSTVANTVTSSVAKTTISAISIKIIDSKPISEINEVQDIDMIVYKTKSGKKYHYKNPCGRGTYYECTLEEALASGLEPCEKCVIH